MVRAGGGRGRGVGEGAGRGGEEGGSQGGGSTSKANPLLKFQISLDPSSGPACYRV